MKTTRLIFGAVAMLAMAHGAFAAELSADAVKRCAAMTDSLARLVCYDQLASGTPSPAAPAPAVAAPAAPPAPAPAPALAPVAPAAAAATVAAPPASRTPALGDESLKTSEEEEAARPKSLTATITALELVRSSNYYMTLDNGQKWLQEEIHTGFHLEVGNTVQIQRGKMGGYRLAYVKDGKPVGTWIRVTRKL